jgi:hypothetical protein
VVAAVETLLRHLFAIHLQFNLSAFDTGRRVLGFAGRFFSSRIFSASPKHHTFGRRATI